MSRWFVQIKDMDREQFRQCVDHLTATGRARFRDKPLSLAVMNVLSWVMWPALLYAIATTNYWPWGALMGLWLLSLVAELMGSVYLPGKRSTNSNAKRTA